MGDAVTPRLLPEVPEATVDSPPGGAVRHPSWNDPVRRSEPDIALGRERDREQWAGSAGNWIRP